jgi:hypothetical protein
MQCDYKYKQGQDETGSGSNPSNTRTNTTSAASPVCAAPGPTSASPCCFRSWLSLVMGDGYGTSEAGCAHRSATKDGAKVRLAPASACPVVGQIPSHASWSCRCERHDHSDMANHSGYPQTWSFGQTCASGLAFCFGHQPWAWPS